MEFFKVTTEGHNYSQDSSHLTGMNRAIQEAEITAISSMANGWDQMVFAVPIGQERLCS